MHKTSEVGQTVRATKVAWLLESRRANATGEDISDERLKRLYLSGRQSFLRHAAVVTLYDAYKGLRYEEEKQWTGGTPLSNYGCDGKCLAQVPVYVHTLRKSGLRQPPV